MSAKFAGHEAGEIYWEKHAIFEQLCKKGIDPFIANCRAWSIMFTKALEKESTNEEDQDTGSPLVR
jgi:hypothetical protein